MPTNDFLPFGVAVGANVSTQEEYLALVARANGFSAGTAASKQLNKAWRQASVMAYVLAQYISTTSNTDVLDNGELPTVITRLAASISATANGGLPYASNAQAAAGTNTNLVISPANLKYYFDTLVGAASETVAGVIRKSTSAEAIAGTSDIGAVTPLKLKSPFVARGLWDNSITGTTNANLPRTTGVYAFNGTTNGPPVGGAFQVFSSTWGADTTWQSDLALGISANSAYIRSIKKDQSAVTPWDKLYCTADFILTGASVGFYLSAPPVGWLRENGAAVSRTTYSALFAVIGTTYGAGDGSTTFNLPDSRSLFSRAADDGKGIDTGRVVGSGQAQSIQSHSHVILNKAITFTYSAPTGGNSPGFPSTGATELTGGAETRPANIAKLYCIKY